MGNWLFGATEQDVADAATKQREGAVKQEREWLTGRKADDEASRFVSAARSGDLEYLQRNMEQLNGKHTDGDTALIASAMANNESVVRFLLGQKSALELNCKDTDGATALMHAVAHRCQQRSLCECECLFTLLVDANANLTKKDNSGWTALHHASAAGNSHALRRLFQEGLDVNSADVSGWPPLFLAAHAGDLQSVQELLFAGANPLADTTTDGCTLLDAANESAGATHACTIAMAHWQQHPQGTCLQRLKEDIMSRDDESSEPAAIREC